MALHFDSRNSFFIWQDVKNYFSNLTLTLTKAPPPYPFNKHLLKLSLCQALGWGVRGIQKWLRYGPGCQGVYDLFSGCGTEPSAILKHIRKVIFVLSQLEPWVLNIWMWFWLEVVHSVSVERHMSKTELLKNKFNPISKEMKVQTMRIHHSSIKSAKMEEGKMQWQWECGEICPLIHC